MGFENPFKRFNKKEVGTTAMAAAALAGGIATGPVGPEIVKAFQPEQEKTKIMQEVNPQELKQMQTPEGMPQVIINPAEGYATVHMKPPGAEVVPTPVDLHEKPTSVDLHEKTISMAPPTSPDVTNQSEHLPNGGY